MLFKVYYHKADGTTATKQFNALNYKDAHEQARADALSKQAEQIRAYPITTNERGEQIPYNIIYTALHIAHNTADKSISRTGGTDTQYTILRDLDKATARMNTAGAELLGCTHLLDIMADMGADANDFVGYAIKGIENSINNGETLPEQTHNGYLTINDYINKQRKATTQEQSLEYVQANGGDFVTINSVIAQIVNGGDKYTPYIENEMEYERAVKLGETIAAAARYLTPRQKQIVVLLGKQYSQRQIAEHLHIKNVMTINEHIKLIRRVYAEYIQENAPQFVDLIKIDIVNEEAKKRSTDRHKNSRAEYMKAYRERKKASKN